MKKFVFAGLMLFVFAGMASAQCKSLTKKKCLPELKPYHNSSKMNTATMRPGDRAEVIIAFNSDINYRLMLCIAGNINVSFKVMDIDRNVFFDSQKDKKNFFDFNVASTQRLIVEITCEEKESLTGITPEGCVSLLTGFQPGH